jgi:hypothetical protein
MIIADVPDVADQMTRNMGPPIVISVTSLHMEIVVIDNNPSTIFIVSNTVISIRPAIPRTHIAAGFIVDFRTQSRPSAV